MNIGQEEIGFNKIKERKKAVELLAQAKKIKRKIRILPPGMSGETYKKLKNQWNTT